TEVQSKWPDRFFCMGMCCTEEEAARLKAAGFKGIAIPGHRISTPLLDMMPMFKYMEREGMVLSMCLGEDERQIAEMGEIIEECPSLKVA
ncbi:amidohydrolase, partial [Salmonella enterica]|uniref:amidohydrolase n=1 Tax=Salmonella enterica TaxID=28901 RepID=UPI0020C2BCE9